MNLHRTIPGFIFISLILFSMKKADALPSDTELLLSLKLNGENQNRIVSFLEDRHHSLWIDDQEIRLWKIQLPDRKLLSGHNHLYYPLNSIRGIKYTIDRTNLSISIETPLSAASLHKINGYTFSKISPEPPSTGGFINYDINGQTTQGTSQLNALLEAGIFSRLGVLTNSSLAQIAGNTHQQIRLTTTWTKDCPDTMQTLRIGDAFTSQGMWGQSVGFGGLQWGTNFSTQPNFIPFPLPQMHGRAAIPSSVDLYVNNAIVSKTNIPSGPFSITNIPVITGQGDVNVVITDILGRQQVINLPSYGSNALLKPGLTDNDFEAGFLRNNFGVQSNDYSQAFLSTTRKTGINDVYTHEWRSELSRSLQNIGSGSTFMIQNTLLVNVSGAVSHATGMGALGLLNVQHTSLSSISYGMNLQMTTRNFMRLGMQSGTFMPSFQNQWFTGFNLKNTSYNIGFTQQINRGQPNARLLSMTASRVIAKNWALNIAGFTNIGGTKNKSFSLVLTRAIDDRVSTSTGFTVQPEASQAQVQVQRSLPTDTGYGFNLNFTQGSKPGWLNTLSVQNSIGNYYVTAARQDAMTGYQAGASGALSLIERHVYWSRSLTNSFGVVNLPGYPGVNVWLNNQIAGKTDRSGNVFIPDLIPYNKNTVSIKPADLPLTAIIEQSEVNVIPWYRSGIVIHFPAYYAADGQARLVLPDKQPLPPGTLVRINNADRVFPVGDNGTIYLSGLKEENHIRAEWGDAHCESDIPYKKTDEPAPDLGVFICR